MANVHPSGETYRCSVFGKIVNEFLVEQMYLWLADYQSRACEEVGTADIADLNSFSSVLANPTSPVK